MLTVTLQKQLGDFNLDVAFQVKKAFLVFWGHRDAEKA